jgi:hypothetical protein
MNSVYWLILSEEAVLKSQPFTLGGIEINGGLSDSSLEFSEFGI